MKAAVALLIAVAPVSLHADDPAAKYREGRKDPNYKALLSHFPEKPGKVLSSQYWPIVFQGGSVLQLTVASESPMRIWRQFESRFLYTADGPITGWIEDGKDLKNSKPLPKLHSADGREHELGAGWKVGVFIARYSETSGFPWNHGETTGIAINEAEQKVLYYAETW
jgi:hypothetical protein